MTKARINTNKNRLKAGIAHLGLGLVSLLGLLVFAGSPVFAGGDAVDTTKAAACASATTIKPVNTTIASEISGCTTGGGRLIRAGEPIPFPICVIDPNFRQLSTTTTVKPEDNCKGGGGVYVAAGQPFPVINNPGAGAAGPVGGTTAKTLVDPTVKTSGKPCGAADQDPVDPVIDLGCKGLGNPILDIIFAFMRFLSLGAGLVMIGSMIAAGIQYSASQGDPQATAAAIKRIVSTVSALAFFIFAYAILNWLVPAGILK